MKPKIFQEATIACALSGLRRQGGSGRFLVADEVGLGKTCVAQGVIKGLLKRRTEPLRVFYICSSLSIIRQNRDALLDFLPKEEQERSRISVDRLTLLPVAKPRSSQLQLYTLTPMTLPSGSRTGRSDERAVIWTLLCRVIDGLTRHQSIKQAFERNVGRWADDLAEAEKQCDLSLAQHFRREIAIEFGRSESAHWYTLVDEMKAAAQADAADFVGRTRTALARAALKNLCPDLIIVDEFQRFFDFMIPRQADSSGEDEDKDNVARGIVELLLGAGQAKLPYLLMLSATPYPLYSGWADGARSHYDNFLRLLTFLFGSSGKRQVSVLATELIRYASLLKSAPVGDSEVMAVRDRVVSSLLTVMTRTERPLSLLGMSRIDFDTCDSPLAAADIALFRHLIDATSDDRHCAPGYWSSIPYPLQAMDARYKLFKTRKQLSYSRTARECYVQPNRVGSFGQISRSHPKLRSLLDQVPPTVLALPWLPPTRTWWALGGRFAEAVRGQQGRPLSKVLLFSRFRAAPRSIASVISYEAERHCFSERNQRGRGIRKPTHYEYRTERGVRPAAGLKRRPGLSFTYPISTGQDNAMTTLLMFMPCPSLASLGDPLPFVFENSDVSYAKVLEHVERKLEAKLGCSPVRRRPGAIWPVVAHLEASSPSGPLLQSTLSKWLSANSRPKSRDKEDISERGVAIAIERFLKPQSPNVPTRAELRTLAEYALLAPGNVVYRAMSRAFPESRDHPEALSWAIQVSMGALRGYLDIPDFHLLFRDRKHREHPSAVRQAVWDGGLESALDEYFVLRRGLGVRDVPEDAVVRAMESLERALSVGVVNVTLHSVGASTDESFKLRCHSALPFGMSSSEVESEAGTFRPDDLRASFNSPFRPHVLASTSIGQEGLDFHGWCNHVVHWDLPGNAVDLEQRDGRVDRYGGLGVRQALARRAAKPTGRASPWREIAESCAEEDGGMTPWWTCPDARIRRTVLIPSLSRMNDDLDRLTRELSLYRMAIGQADQESLIQALHRRINEAADAKPIMEWFDRARIDLRPLRMDFGKASAELPSSIDTPRQEMLQPT